MSEFPPLWQVLPHDPPMILIDRIEEAGAETVTCTVTLRPDSPFVENGWVSAVVATEYMAQTVAAWAGLQARQKGKPVRTGYVIGARRIRLEVDSFRPGDKLTVKARRVWGDDILGQFECSVESRGERVAVASLSVFQGDPETAEAIRRGSS